MRCLPDTFLRMYSLPHLTKFVQTPALLIMLNEVNAGYRQVFLDGRALPVDPNPSWQGYSSATWKDDTLVVTSKGFRDDIWIDWNGSRIGGSATVIEKFRRPDYGHLEIEVTADDPKAYTKPWTVTLQQRLALDTELVDEICLENDTWNWNDLTVGDLFERIRATMPIDNPGQLPRPQTADVIAFVRWANSWPDGRTELPPEPAALRQIRIQATKVQ